MKNRNKEIDIFRALLIIFVVLGHVRFPGRGFIYLFHVPLFFVLSGYCDKNSYNSLNDVLTNLIKKIKRLYIPYVLGLSFIILFHNFFIKYNLLTIEPLLDYSELDGAFETRTTFLFSGGDIYKNIIRIFLLQGDGGVLGGAYWYIATLFEISVLFCIVSFVVRNTKNKRLIIWIIVILTNLFGWLKPFKTRFGDNGFGNINLVFSYFLLYYIGVLLREKSFFVTINKLSLLKKVICWISSLATLFLLNKCGYVACAQNYYENPLFLLTSTFSGGVFCYGLVCIFKKKSIISKLMVIIGRHSLAITMWHFFAFRIVNYIYVNIYCLDIHYLASETVIKYDLMWELIYTIFGLMIPVVGSSLCEKIVIFNKNYNDTHDFSKQ